MRRLVFACMLAGCGFEHGSGSGDGGMPDVIDGRDGGPCMTYSSLFDTCTVGATGTKPSMTLSGGTWTYNTDNNTLTSPSAVVTNPPHVIVSAASGPIDVIFASSFILEGDAVLRVVGPSMDRPFGIASTGPVQIRGVIDLGSNGAGARDDSACGLQTGARGQNSNGGAGGGGGGALQGDGGDGGDGNKDGTITAGGNGGSGLSTRPASPLGGCDGGDGGDGSADGGLGGDGGGAIYIASGTSIAVTNTGVIDAGGGGGAAGGENGDGGGGGGSGGYILLESVSVSIAGIVVANGGGGGEGNNGRVGQPGQRSASRAPAGVGGDANGGDGAEGGAGSMLDGVDAEDLQNGGGGGGGGGVGFIAIASASPMTSSAVISPPFAAFP